jgi:Helix-turn-helix domain
MDELASLQESAREMALERFRIIQPHLEHDRSLSLIARTTKIPYRTIHRWLTRYRRFGLAALARKAREDRGKRRALSPRLMQVAEALALEVPPLPVAAIYRRICQIAKDTGNSAPSYDVIYEVVRQVPAGLLTLAHEGKKAYSAAFDLVHRREFRPLSSAEVRQLLAQGWKPAGVTFPTISTLDAEAAAAIIRVTGGNFRLLDRLLTQMERIMRINDLAQVTKDVVESARESLVIGPE